MRLCQGHKAPHCQSLFPEIQFQAKNMEHKQTTMTPSITSYPLRPGLQQHTLYHRIRSRQIAHCLCWNHVSWLIVQGSGYVHVEFILQAPLWRLAQTLSTLASLEKSGIIASLPPPENLEAENLGQSLSFLHLTGQTQVSVSTMQGMVGN